MLVAGLGNPGPAYELTRHNFGFLATDRLLLAYGRAESMFSSAIRGDCLTGEARVIRNMLPILLVKPQTYMNLSGRAVVKLVGKFSFTPLQVFIIHDDLDLPLGRMKLSKGGGDGGHNGVASVTDELGSRDFFRLRLGIGRPCGSGRDYVLEGFGDTEMPVVEAVLEQCVKTVMLFLRKGEQIAIQAANSFRFFPD